MDDDKKHELIEHYLDAYNTFDLEAIMKMIHPDVEFTNICNGHTNTQVSGAEAFQQLAKASEEIFSSRRQIMKQFWTKDDQAFIVLDYEGVLATDLPDGLHAGETVRLKGRSEFTFRDGQISRITDIS
jgi:ketosteroid isomerase-like protein